MLNILVSSIQVYYIWAIRGKYRRKRYKNTAEEHLKRVNTSTPLKCKNKQNGSERTSCLRGKYCNRDILLCFYSTLCSFSIDRLYPHCFKQNDECTMRIIMKILTRFIFFTSSESIYTANITTYRTAIHI